MKRYGWNFLVHLPRIWRWKPALAFYMRPAFRFGVYAYRDEEDRTPTLVLNLVAQLEVSFYRAWTRREQRAHDERLRESLAGEASSWLVDQ